MFPEDEEPPPDEFGDIFDPVAAKQAYLAEQQTATTAVASPPTTIFDAPTTDPNYLTPVADAFVGTNTYEAPSISDSPNTSLYDTPIIDLSVNPSPYDSTSVADIPQYIPPEPTPSYDPYASVPPVETYVPPTENPFVEPYQALNPVPDLTGGGDIPEYIPPDSTLYYDPYAEVSPVETNVSPTAIFDAPVESTAASPVTTTTVGPIAPGGGTNTVGGAEIIGADGGIGGRAIQAEIDLLNQELDQIDPNDPDARSRISQINEAIFNLNQRMNQLLGTYNPNVVQPNPNVTPTTPTTPGTSVGPINPAPGAAKSPIDLAVERNVASARAKVGGRELTDDEIAMAVNGAMLEVYGPPDPTKKQDNIFTIFKDGVPLIIPLPIDPALAALLSLGSIFAGGIPSLFPSGSTPAGVTGGTPGGAAGGTAGGTTGGTGTSTGGGTTTTTNENPMPEEAPPANHEWVLVNGVWQAVPIAPPPNQPPGPNEEWKRVDGIWILVPKPAGPQPDCPPGKERDASGECVDQPTECAPGYVKGPDGKCIPIVINPPPEEEPCPVGQVRGPDGKCIPLVVNPLPCPPGQTRGADGQCAPIVNPPPPPPPPEECPVGQVKGSDGVCRPIIVLPPPPPPPPPPQPPPTIFTPVTTTPYTFVKPEPGNLIMRDYGKEFGTTSEAMRAQAEPILALYQDILSRYTPGTLNQMAGTAQQRLGTDLAALQAVEQGQLSAEDVRRAQQSAREAYGARGMLFSPGAVGAEILNRQAIQDAREAEARSRYQQSIQNLASAAQLQTGNIFQPVASLLSQTFSPTSNYANAVYDYNVNAYNAYQAAQENLAAYREAAKSGQQDQFLASFGNFLLKNGITTTRNQLADLFQGILNLGR